MEINPRYGVKETTRKQRQALSERVAALNVTQGRKLSPLAEWSADQVDAYIAANQVPLHALYAKGYATIGCGPCTRAIKPGEALRAGRWWWENEGDKECGLHVTPKGQLKRELDVLLEEIISVDA